MKRCLNGAFGAPFEPFRFSSAMAFSNRVRPSLAPAQSGLPRVQQYTENVCVNKPSIPSCHLPPHMNSESTASGVAPGITIDPATTGVGHHLRRTLRLALPVMLSRAGMVLMLTVDTAIVGHLAFADRQLAALGAALIPQAVLQTAAIGLLIG